MMPDSAHLTGILLTCGIVLAKVFVSPLGGPFGVIVPVASGIQALTDWAAGKVKLRHFPETTDAAADVRRESLRSRIQRLWIAQIFVAIVSGTAIIWLYILDEIPKVGTPPIATPDVFQSALLILLFLTTTVALVLALLRARTTLGLDQSN
jgi:hypothetical protein